MIGNNCFEWQMCQDVLRLRGRSFGTFTVHLGINISRRCLFTYFTLYYSGDYKSQPSKNWHHSVSTYSTHIQSVPRNTCHWHHSVSTYSIHWQCPTKNLPLISFSLSTYSIYIYMECPTKHLPLISFSVSTYSIHIRSVPRNTCSWYHSLFLHTVYIYGVSHETPAKF